MMKMKKIGAVLLSTLMITSMAGPQPVSAQTARLKASHFKSDSLKLKWNSFGSTYAIYRSAGKKFKKIATTKALSFTDHKLDDRKTYTYKVKSGKVTSNSVEKVRSHVTFSKEKTLWDANMTKKHKKAVSNYAASFVNTKIQKGMPTLVKIGIAADTIGKRVKYSENAKYSTSVAYGPVAYRVADCGGYASLFKALCDAMNIGCWVIQPRIDPDDHLSSAHIFNLLKVHGKWYAVDVEFYYLSMMFDSDGRWINKVNKKGKWIYDKKFASDIKKAGLYYSTASKTQHIPHVSKTYNGIDKEYAETYIDSRSGSHSMTLYDRTYDSCLKNISSYYHYLGQDANSPFGRKISKESTLVSHALQSFAKKNPEIINNFKELTDLYNKNKPKKDNSDQLVDFSIKHLNNARKLKISIEFHSDYQITFDQNGHVSKNKGYDRVKNDLEPADEEEEIIDEEEF